MKCRYAHAPALWRLLGEFTAVLLLCVMAACRGGGGGNPPPSLPTIASFSAARSLVTAGETTVLTAVFNHGTGVISNGIGRVDSGTGVSTADLAADTTFYLTVTNDAGSSITAQVTVAVVAAPTITRFVSSPPAVAIGGSSTLAYSFTNGTGTINQAVGSVNSDDKSTVVPVTTTSFTLTVTNAAGRSETAQATVEVLSVGVLSLFAGAPTGSGNIDGPGEIAKFNSPHGLAADHSGNIFVADTANGTVRKIAPDHTVSTFAGKAGEYGSTDGTSLEARFNTPRGMAVDGAGNLYLADDSTIRKITPSGQVKTLAGVSGQTGTADGTGVEARFYYPAGLAVDLSGNIFVADTVNHAIRKVTPEGVVSTVAGRAGQSGSANGLGTAAAFCFPNAVAVDALGNVYVADSGNDLIRIVLPSGQVATLAGKTGMQGSTDGPGVTALFSAPEGVAVDGAGNLYVTDVGNHAIRKIAATPERTVSTVAGTAGVRGGADGFRSTASFSAFNGLTIDQNGTAFIVDTDSIRKMEPAGMVRTLAGIAASPGSADGPGGVARFYKPFGVASDNLGSVYVADTSNNIIRKISPTGVVSTFAGTAGAPGAADGQGAAARFSSPGSLAVDPSGNVYVADSGNHVIRKISSTGMVSTFAGSAGQPGSIDGMGADARFSGPEGVALDHSGDVYVTDSLNATLRKISPGGLVTTLAGIPGSTGSSDGLGPNARFQYPAGIAVDGSGTIYVSDVRDFTIRKITPAGAVSTFAGAAGIQGSTDGSGGTARFYGPMGLAMDSSGNIYVADFSNHLIRRVSPTGTVSTVVGVAGRRGAEPGILPGCLEEPLGVAVDMSTGHLFIAMPDAILKAIF